MEMRIFEIYLSRRAKIDTYERRTEREFLSLHTRAYNASSVCMCVWE